MKHSLDLAGESYSWDIKNREIIVEGYDFEDEEIGMNLTGVLSPIVAFWKCAQAWLDKYGEADLLAFMNNEGNYALLRDFSDKEYQSWSKERKRLRQQQKKDVLRDPTKRNLQAIKGPELLDGDDVSLIDDSVVLAFLAHTGNDEIKKSVASNPYADMQTLSLLASDPNKEVHSNILKNPATPDALVDGLAEKYSYFPFIKLLNSTLSRSECEVEYKKMKDPLFKPHLPLETLLKTRNPHVLCLLAQEDDQNILWGVCQNERTTDQDLLTASSKLDKSQYIYTRTRLAGLKRLPTSVRLEMARKEKGKEVYKAALAAMTPQEKELFESQDLDISL